MIRRQPLSKVRRSTLGKTGKKPRMWACAHCPQKNPPTKRKCQGCGIGRTTKRTSLSTRCDTLWAQLVKAPGKCAAVGHIYVYSLAQFDEFQRTHRGEPACSGALEAAHVVPRRHRSVRWDPLNGRPLCHAHHRYFTDHEKAWRDFIGPEWDRLWEKAQERWNKTFPVAELRAALNQRRAA